MALIRVTGPSVEPVTIDEIKSVLHIDYDDDDIAVNAYIKAARDKIERRCGRVLIQQVWEMRQAGFGQYGDDLHGGLFDVYGRRCEWPYVVDRPIEFPLPPTRSVESITYIDQDGATQTLDPSTYDFIDGGDIGISSVIPLSAWPTRDEIFQRPDAVRIQFTAGYAPSDDDPPDYTANVPEGLRQGIRWLCGHMVNNRESVVVAPTRQAIMELPDSVDAIIAPFIVPRL